MAVGRQDCSICGESFLVKRPAQIERGEGDDAPTFFCSESCRDRKRSGAGEVLCSVCDEAFSPAYAYQTGGTGGGEVYFCSMECRRTASETRRQAASTREPMRIAVLNQKGGTGKTTTSVSLAAGLAEEGEDVLLVDLDSQGHIGISLGVEAEHTLYDMIVGERTLDEVTVPARPNLDVLVADESVASAEIYLARMEGHREKQLDEHLSERADYDYVLLDCGPSLSLLNKNALTYADELIVPVACDFLSLVGVKQVLQTLEKANRELIDTVEILGILPTFYDVRNNISEEAIKTLEGHFQDKVLPPIRVNTKLKEAPGENETIFEYAPGSRGAEDYAEVVDWLLDQRSEHRRAS